MQRPSLLVSALLVAAASAALHGASSSTARADSFLILGGGMIFPLGDENWEDLAESSPTFFVRGGGGRKVQAHARLLIEGSFEVTPISTSLNDSAIADLDVSRYRALLGVRYEQRIGHAALISLRGGFGIDHLRGELTTPLGSDSDNDTGLALELGGGPWFQAGPVLLGFELAMPIGLHDDNTFDFRSTDLSLLAGVRFIL